MRRRSAHDDSTQERATAHIWVDQVRVFFGDLSCWGDDDDSPLTGFAPAVDPAWVLQSTLGITIVGGALTIAIPDLSIQVMGEVAPRLFPTYVVTGVPVGAPVVLYINYPLGPGLRPGGCVGVQLNPNHIAAALGQYFGDIPRGATHFKHSLVGTDKIEDKRVAVVLSVGIDRRVVDVCHPVSLSLNGSAEHYNCVRKSEVTLLSLISNVLFTLPVRVSYVVAFPPLIIKSRSS